MAEIKLGPLLQAIGYRLTSSQPVLDLTNDSRQVRPGSLFFAVPGFRADGHDFIPAAVQAGAIGVVAQRPHPGLPVPLIQVKNTRKAQAILAAEFYGWPSRELKLAGITGTNGKTSCTFMLEEIFRAAGLCTGLMGTLYNKVKDIVLPTANTSPDSILCQRLLREMVKVGATHASMEVSSHAMVMNRADCLAFAVGAITNFSPDHLDFHGGVANYAEAKKRFFQLLPPESFAVVNLDDKGCVEITAATRARRLGYSLRDPGAHIALAAYRPRDFGGAVTIRVNSPDLPGSPRTIDFTLELPGRHNLANALLAAGTALALGVDADAVAAGLSQYKGIFRRFEVIYQGEFRVIDDAAHNPSNLDAVFHALAEENPAAVAVVYAIRGSRGVEINRANAATLARWANRLNLCPLIVTNCSDTAAPQDRVLPPEEEAFAAALAGLGDQVLFTDTLRQGVRLAIESLEPGKTLLLLGAHPMDDVSGLFAELAGVETTVRPRPPHFGPTLDN